MVRRVPLENDMPNTTFLHPLIVDVNMDNLPPPQKPDVWLRGSGGEEIRVPADLENIITILCVSGFRRFYPEEGQGKP